MDATIQNGIALNPKSILTKVDTTPTADSNNPVSSDGVKTYVDQKDQATNIRVDTLNTQIAASFFFKGSSTFAELPASGNTVNDTYYVTDSDKECWYSWNGTDWIKSSMSQADYAGLIAQLKADVSAEYSTSKTYKVGDYCLYGADGVLYICKIAVTTAGAFDSNKWQAISFGEAVGDLVIADDTQPTSLANKIWLDTDPNPDTVEVITEEDLGNIVAGEFDSVSAYAVGDYCIHDAKLYVAKTATAANDGWIAARWQQVTVMGTINDQVGELKTQINDLSDQIDVERKTASYQQSRTKKSATKTGTTIFIDEKCPINYSSDKPAIIHGINRFDLDSATFAMSGYSASYTISKENGGIKIETTLTNTTSANYAYFEYTAEFTGTLYVSCDAKLLSGKINTVVMIMFVNGVEVDKSYGEGIIFLGADVVAGDTIKCGFYGHLAEGVASTVAYKNIMLTYGRYFDYAPFIADKPSGAITPIYEEKALSSYINDATYQSTPKWVLFSGLISDALGLPPSKNVAMSADHIKVICDEEIPIYAYNEFYSATTETGIAISDNGSVGFRIDGLNKTNTTAWLQEHPVTIVYVTGETREGNDIQPQDFQQGIILTFSTTANITYDYTGVPKAKSIVCFGDSITGIFVGKNDYPVMLGDIGNIKAVNAGFSGCCWTDHPNADNLPFCMNRIADAIVSEDWSLQDASPKVDSTSPKYDPAFAEHLTALKNTNWLNIDYVSIFYGTNDWGNNTILYAEDDPEAENKQRYDVESAVKYSITQLVTKYPHLKILLITPYWRAITQGKDSNTQPNTSGAFLYEFSDAIATFGEENFNIPVINLYRSFGANVITNRYFTKDGTHPTEMGKRIIAERITNILESY